MTDMRFKHVDAATIMGLIDAYAGAYAEDDGHTINQKLREQYYEISDIIHSLSGSDEDSRMLSWLNSQGEAYGFENYLEGYRWTVDGPFTDVRSAIRDAMKWRPPC
jgi:hypothetical protein